MILQDIKDGKKVEIKYYDHGLVTFNVKFDDKSNHVHFKSEDEKISFSLDRADHDDCEYACLALGILI